MRCVALLLLVLVLAGLLLPPAHAEVSSIAYLCFFSEGGTALEDASGRCRGILAEAAMRWQHARDGTAQTMTVPPQPISAQIYLVEVHGHDDAAASPQESLRHSVLRAVAVAEALIRLGVPAEIISVHGHGSARPMMPAPGAEPQNRQVYVRFRLPDSNEGPWP